MRKVALSVVVLLILWTPALALTFPALTGRVVDHAHILSPGTISTLDKMLGDYERGTSNQVVVVTLPSLEGTPIEDYGYQLGRHWQIGQKGQNNGALLIVAPRERKVRIEVGYGLEPLLTDAASSTIVQAIILPAFRAGQLEQGIVKGTEAMLSVLGGKGLPADLQREPTAGEALMFLLFLFAFMWFASRHPLLAALMLSNSSFRSHSSHGGGFSGGGGSFGGGGASGSW
jgi:uncharacterized protein